MIHFLTNREKHVCVHVMFPVAVHIATSHLVRFIVCPKNGKRIYDLLTWQDNS